MSADVLRRRSLPSERRRLLLSPVLLSIIADSPASGADAHPGQSATRRVLRAGLHAAVSRMRRGS